MPVNAVLSDSQGTSVQLLSSDCRNAIVTAEGLHFYVMH